MILYEYPFNESIRTMLRLEHLFDRLGQLIERDTPVDHHYALATIFEVMDVASRADLKSDLLKDLDPIAEIAANPQVLCARKTMQAQNLVELLAWMKANVLDKTPEDFARHVQGLRTAAE